MSLRETKNRIKSVKNTEKITRAMKMVAASKLRRAQDAVIAPRPFSLKLSQIISDLALKISEDEGESIPLLQKRANPKTCELLVVTSDRGLCGALNSNAVRTVSRFILDHEEKFSKFEVSVVGKKGYEGLSRLGVDIRKYYEPKEKVFSYEEASLISLELCDRYVENQSDEIYLVYNEFKSAITQNIVIEKILPVSFDANNSSDGSLDYLYEPNKEDLLSSLIPKHFAVRIHQAILENHASEQGARMTAMDNATRNAKEMTEKLTLEYNRARQAAITKELMEIIGGAEAL